MSWEQTEKTTEILYCNDESPKKWSTDRAQAQLLEDLNEILESRRQSDICFRVNGKHFPAHSLFLTIRCPKILAARDTTKNKLKFCKCGGSNVKDKKGPREIALENIDEDIVKELLRYSYTGCVSRARMADQRLLKLAIDYDIKSLKEMCEEAFRDYLNVNNCVDILILADLYKTCQLLKMEAIKFIKDNKKNVVDTVAFKNLRENHNHLLQQLFCAIAKEEKC